MSKDDGLRMAEGQHEECGCGDSYCGECRKDQMRRSGPSPEMFYATCKGTDGVQRTIMITRAEYDELLRRGATDIDAKEAGNVE